MSVHNTQHIQLIECLLHLAFISVFIVHIGMYLQIHVYVFINYISMIVHYLLSPLCSI